jgi:hypothetical protein
MPSSTFFYARFKFSVDVSLLVLRASKFDLHPAEQTGIAHAPIQGGLVLRWGPQAKNYSPKPTYSSGAAASW